jgi:uncharacterized membrane protein
MILLNELAATLPIAFVFGILFWVIIFLETYRHYPAISPRHKPEGRLQTCIVNATILTVIVMGAVYLALWFILQN